MNTRVDGQDDAIVQAADWTLRLDAAPSDAALKAEFERWLAGSEAHRDAWHMVRYASATLDQGRHRRPADAPAAGKIVPLPAARPRRVRWLAAAAAVAAALLLVVAFPALQKHLLADHVTGVAELREVVLPDGSTAHLDAGSAIAVDYDREARRVALLSGQAFFEVVRNADRPFRVEADAVTVVVTGTAFGVNRTAQSVSVSVQSGTVEVARPGGAVGDRLGRGDRWTWDRQDGSVRRDEVRPADVALWRTRRLVVHEAAFEDVLEEIGRHMPGAIVVRDGALNRRLVSGVYDLSRPREALEALAGSQRATVTRITPYLAIVSAP